MKIIDLIRAIVRPYVTISGWTAILVLAIVLGIKFADKDLALALVGIVTGTMATVIGFWFRDRQRPPQA